MNKTLEEIYIEEVLNEGFFDRLGARAAGALGAMKGAGQTIGGLAKGAIAGMKGDTAGVEAAKAQREKGGIKAGYNQAKLKSITNTFQNEMKALFGDEWAKTYPKLAQELQAVATPSTTSTPATPTAPATPEAPTAPTDTVDKSKPLTAGAIVTGTGNKLTKGKFQVVQDKGKTVVVQPYSEKQKKPYGKSVEVSRQDAIAESQKTKFDDIYGRFNDVPKL